jgi:glycosyltransferase involved in cell wall biosynthesis
VTAAIRRLIEDRDLASSLVERGRGRVELFTWRRTAEATLETYRRAVAASRSSARS